jgi:hypothetical protein
MNAQICPLYWYRLNNGSASFSINTFSANGFIGKIGQFHCMMAFNPFLKRLYSLSRFQDLKCFNIIVGRYHLSLFGSSLLNQCNQNILIFYRKASTESIRFCSAAVLVIGFSSSACPALIMAG